MFMKPCSVLVDDSNEKKNYPSAIQQDSMKIHHSLSGKGYLLTSTTFSVTS